jgi:hypothetical protein
MRHDIRQDFRQAALGTVNSGKNRPNKQNDKPASEDEVQQASEESFPASDPPGSHVFIK